MRKMKNAYKTSSALNPERKRPVKRPRSTWEDNIKVDLREIWMESV
jgi:hypothetical protein